MTIETTRNGASRRPRASTPKPTSGNGTQGTMAGWKKRFDHYTALAKEYGISNDRVAQENSYQHAEHYFRLMNAQPH
ncbi:DUF4167 domain-containing protein [Tepidicaulis marinus]|nr:DUF4167 domain-containing protein [Tepidicaulis marinus]